MSVQFTATDWLWYEPNGAVFNYNAAYTVTMWVRPEDTATWRSYFAVTTTLNSQNEDSVGADGSNPNHFQGEVQVGGSYSGSAISTAHYTSGQWVFVAIRRNSSTVLELYVDTAVAATGPTADVSGRDNTDAAYGIACWRDNNGGFVGRIAQVRIWTAALSDGELATEKAYTYATASVKASHPGALYAEYRLVNLAGATTDSSGNTRTLTSNGSNMATGADDPPGQTAGDGGGGPPAQCHVAAVRNI